MVTVKCVICSKSFNNKEALINHFVEEHNVPIGDTILNRYVNLRFSSTSGDMRASNLRIMLTLLKLLKQRAAKYTVERNKIKLNKSKIRSLFDEFLNFEDVDSEYSTNSFVSEESERLTLVNWFLTYYNVFVNNDAAVLSNEENKKIISFYTAVEREGIKCSRIKVEQKDNLELDFNDQSKIPHNGSSPYESFSIMIKTMFFKFFSNLNKNENSCQIMFEITTEFVKSEEESETYEFEENYDGTSEMYAECEERRVIKEYSALSSGHILNIKQIFNEGLSDISRKVLNSFNVTGSNWSLRRIINLYLNIVYDVKSYSSISRLVKGRIPTKSLETNVSPNNSGEKFAKLWEMCYQQVRLSRDIRIKMARLMKGQAADLSRKSKIPELDFEDHETINSFVKTHFKIAGQIVHSVRDKQQKKQDKQQKHVVIAVSDVEETSEVEEEEEDVDDDDYDEKPTLSPPSYKRKPSDIHTKLMANSSVKRNQCTSTTPQPPKKKAKKSEEKNFTTKYIPPKIPKQRRKVRNNKPIEETAIFSSKNNQKNIFKSKINKRKSRKLRDEESIELRSEIEEESEDDQQEQKKLDQEMVSIFLHDLWMVLCL